MRGRVVGIVSVIVTELYPSGLLSKLPRGFQIIRTQFFRRHVIVCLQGRIDFYLGLVLDCLVTLIDDVRSARAGDQNAEQENKLEFLPSFWSHCHIRKIALPSAANRW